MNNFAVLSLKDMKVRFFATKDAAVDAASDLDRSFPVRVFAWSADAGVWREMEVCGGTHSER